MTAAAVTVAFGANSVDLLFDLLLDHGSTLISLFGGQATSFDLGVDLVVHLRFKQVRHRADVNPVGRSHIGDRLAIAK